MCMVNVNSTMELYDDVIGDIENRKFVKLFDSIDLSKDEDGAFIIKNIYLVINLNIVRSTNPQNIKYNVLNNRGLLEAQVQFVKDEEQKRSISIVEFTYDFNDEKNILEYDNGEYFSQKRILKIESMPLPIEWGAGDYRFELLLKRTLPEYSDDNWILQTICPLTINEKKEEQTIAKVIE